MCKTTFHIQEVSKNNYSSDFVSLKIISSNKNFYSVIIYAY